MVKQSNKYMKQDAYLSSFCQIWVE